MDFTGLIDAVNAVGFPFAMCIILIVYMWKTEEKHSQALDKVTEALQNNTEVMTKIATKLGLNDKEA